MDHLIFYSIPETIIIVLVAIILDRLIGDPRWLPHPVIWIGRLIGFLERRLLREKGPHLHEKGRHLEQDARASKSTADDRERNRYNGILLTVIVTLTAFAAVWLICVAAAWLHPWLGYAAQVWLIATTIAVKGLKDAAMIVYKPLEQGDLATACKHVGYIVGRDTDTLDEAGVSRAAVETVAENTVDAFISPIIYALLGAAPLAMLYRATNTLDSMVGYKNDKYRFFGWASARWDDVMNYIPARVTGVLLIIAAFIRPNASSIEAASAIKQFAHLHSSPNSGIPESAVAGALGIELGGLNSYGGIISERARMGWPTKPIDREHIIQTIQLMVGVRNLVAGGLLCVLLVWVCFN